MVESKQGIQACEPRMSYLKCPLHRYTFKVKKIREFVESYARGKVLNLFAGLTRLNLNEYRVDLDPECNPDHLGDSREFVSSTTMKFDSAILDPPYSLRKSMEFYKGHRASPFAQIVDNLSNILNPQARVISLGYSSTCMGKSRGFDKIAIGLCCHGGAFHDTIILVEERRIVP